MAVQYIGTNTGFLSENASTPRVYISAETDDFDESTLEAWRDEGFQVGYIPLGNGGKAYIKALKGLEQGLSIGERYAIVAFGDAASVCLEHFSDMSSASAKLCALVAYYPTRIPAIQTRFSSSFRVLVHLAGSEIGVFRKREVLGIQGKQTTVQKRVTPGVGPGSLQTKMNYRTYTYEGAEPGFAEQDLDEYDNIADAVAWSRSLNVVRRAFGAEVELEKVVDEAQQAKWRTQNADKFMHQMGNNPDMHVNYGPTMTGGIGKEDIDRFYREFFIPSTPPSFIMRLVSRTIGSDRVVDELLVAFKHTKEMPWLLPGIPPTNKKVELMLVSIVALKAGKLYSEHVYWDQASVLYQTGLLDPENVPDDLQDKGVKSLPVCGGESAIKMADMESEDSNELLEEW